MKGAYNKETREYSGQLFVLGVNDAGSLETVKTLDIPFRFSASLISNKKTKAAIGIDNGKFLIVNISK